MVHDALIPILRTTASNHNDGPVRTRRGRQRERPGQSVAIGWIDKANLFDLVRIRRLRLLRSERRPILLGGRRENKRKA